MPRIVYASALMLRLLAPPGAAAEAVIPDFDAAVFVAGTEVTNPYFPLAPASSTILASISDDSGQLAEESHLAHAGTGRVILGVQTSAQRDRAYPGGRLVEETFDYYAQDADGNVWYMGEDVTNFVYIDRGTLTGTNNASAWIAGVDGARPGWIMPAAASTGLAFFQEFAPANEALDQAKIHTTGQTLEIDGTVFENVIVVLETTRLAPNSRELDYYAPGISLIRVEEGLNAPLSEPERIFELKVASP